MNATHAAARISREAIGFGERSLELLQMIEKTVDGLCADSAMLTGLADGIGKAAREVTGLKPVKPLDNAAAVAAALNSGIGAAAKIHQIYIGRRAAARKDPSLTEEDGLEDEFSNVIAAAADFHNAMNALLQAIEEYDATLEQPSGETFTDVDQLLAAMAR